MSTVDDFLAFGRMMLNHGKHGSERILSRLSVELMTTDHITAEQKAASSFFPDFRDSRGWGFGVSIITRRDDMRSSRVAMAGTAAMGRPWYVDPKEDLVGILMTQRVWDSPGAPAVQRDFWTAVYQAIED